MAIYRPPKPRWPLAVAAGVGGLLVGLLIGLMLGSGDPDPAEAAQEVRTALTASAGSLEIVAIEYAESVSDGAIESQPEYDGAVAALESSHTAYEEVAGALRELAPANAAAIEQGFDDIQSLVDDLAEPGEVEGAIQDQRDLLTGT